MTSNDVAAQFEARPIGAGRWRARCPAHEDRTPSLDIAVGGGGRTLLLCRAGCSTAEVLRVAGLDWSDLFVADQARKVCGVTQQQERAINLKRRAERGLREWAEAAGRRLRDQVYLRHQLIAFAEELLNRDRRDTDGAIHARDIWPDYGDNPAHRLAGEVLAADRGDEAGWELLRIAYHGLAQTEWLLDCLDSRRPEDWLVAFRLMDESK